MTGPEVGDDDEKGREDGEEDRELEPDQRQAQVEEDARDEHVDHNALEPARPMRSGGEASGGSQPRAGAGGKSEKRPFDERLRIDRDVEGGQEHEDERSQGCPRR